MTRPSSTCILLLIILAASQAEAAEASPKNATTENTSPGNTIKNDISCYSLPYGGLGFASHILTYLTVLALSFGRSPIMPWRRLRGERWNFITTAISTCVSLAMAIVSMTKCGGAWPFILVSVWKLTFSLTLSVMTVHAVHIAGKLVDEKKLGFESINRWMSMFKRPSKNDQQHSMYPQPHGSYQPRNSWGWYGSRRMSWGSERDHYPHNSSQHYPYASSWDLYPDYGRPVSEYEYGAPAKPSDDVPWDEDFKEEFRKIWWWCAFYFFGAFVGLIGILAIAGENMQGNGQLQITTGAFGGTVGLVVCGFLLTFWPVDSPHSFIENSKKGKRAVTYATVFVFLFIMTLLVAFYSDWVLAAVAHDNVGTPTDENKAVYYTYLVAKRVPMFSF